LPTNGVGKKFTSLGYKRPEEPPASIKLAHTNVLHLELCNASVRITLDVNFGFIKTYLLIPMAPCCSVIFVPPLHMRILDGSL
jgi:hypothetical protein